MTDETKGGYLALLPRSFRPLFCVISHTRGIPRSYDHMVIVDFGEDPRVRGAGGYLPMRGGTVTVRYLSPIGLRRIDRRSTATVMMMM